MLLTTPQRIYLGTRHVVTKPSNPVVQKIMKKFLSYGSEFLIKNLENEEHLSKLFDKYGIINNLNIYILLNQRGSLWW